MSNVIPIRTHYTTAELLAAEKQELIRSRNKFINYAKTQGWATTDENGEPMTALDIAWKQITDNRILMEPKRNLHII